MHIAYRSSTENFKDYILVLLIKKKYALTFYVIGPILGTRAIKTKKEKAQMEEIFRRMRRRRGRERRRRKERSRKEERGRMDLRDRKKGKWTNLIGCWAGNK